MFAIYTTSHFSAVEGLQPSTPCKQDSNYLSYTAYYLRLGLIITSYGLRQYLSHLAINPVTVPNRIFKRLSGQDPDNTTEKSGLEDSEKINCALTNLQDSRQNASESILVPNWPGICDGPWPGHSERLLTCPVCVLSMNTVMANTRYTVNKIIKALEDKGESKDYIIGYLQGFIYGLVETTDKDNLEWYINQSLRQVQR